MLTMYKACNEPQTEPPASKHPQNLQFKPMQVNGVGGRGGEGFRAEHGCYVQRPWVHSTPLAGEAVMNDCALAKQKHGRKGKGWAVRYNPSKALLLCAPWFTPNTAGPHWT